MKRSKVHPSRASLVKAMIAMLMMITLLVVPNTVTRAAAAPSLTKTTRDILVGATYNLDVNNKVKQSKYTWTTSNKKFATVNSKGVVKGINKGVAVITCTVKAPKKTYKLTCKVTVLKPANSFTIKNKVTALNQGQTIDFEGVITPSTSNDKTTWTSNNKYVAVPDAQGKFTAFGMGIVTITGKTLSGESDSTTIKVVDKEGTVSNQEELDALVGNGVNFITIKTNNTVDLTIPNGDYTKTKLVVDAPNAEVHNNGKFASIDIKQVATSSWYENVKGNQLNITDPDARIVVAPNATVKLNINNADAKLKLENNGLIEQVVVQNAADIDITGSSKTVVPMMVNAKNLTLVTKIPLDLNLTEKIELSLYPGTEGTKINVASTDVMPVIKGNYKLNVTIGEGSTAYQQEVIPYYLPIETPGGGFGGGGIGGGDASNDVTKTVNDDGSITYTSTKSYASLSSMNIIYSGSNFYMSGGMLNDFKKLLDNDPIAVLAWKTTIKSVDTYGSQKVTTTGTYGNTKTLTFDGGQLHGKSFVVTVGTGTISITDSATSVTFTLTKLDDYNLRINANTEVTFVPTF